MPLVKPLKLFQTTRTLSLYFVHIVQLILGAESCSFTFSTNVALTIELFMPEVMFCWLGSLLPHIP